MLLKVHHLIITEEDDIHISEMLMLKDGSGEPVVEINDISGRNSKLNGISSFVHKPKHIGNLFKHINLLVINQWNKFVYEFESLETPDGTVGIKISNISQLLSVLLIIAVNVSASYWKTVSSKQNKLLFPKNHVKEERYTIIKKLYIKEMAGRHLSWNVAKEAIRASLQFTNLTKSMAKFLWQVNVNIAISFPYYIYTELKSLKDLILKGKTTLSMTFCSRLSLYIPLFIYAQMDIIKILYEIFMAPVNIFEEIWQYPSREENKLHKMSYSGRKIISFSKAIEAKDLRKRMIFNEELQEFDLTLSCLAAAIYDYFEFYRTEVPVPKILNTTCRTMAKGYFTNNVSDKTDFIGGVVFLQLPLQIPDREHAKQIHSIIERIKRKQIMIYLASIAQTKFDMLTSIFPSVLTKICINYFSSNFPVTITEIHGENSEFQTLWGQTVEDVLLFRPPQSKTCEYTYIYKY